MLWKQQQDYSSLKKNCVKSVRRHNATYPETWGRRQFFQADLYRVQVVAEDKRKAELRHRVSVPITKKLSSRLSSGVWNPTVSHVLFYRNLQPLCQTDLAPYHLAHLRKHPAGKRFSTGANVKEAVHLGADTWHRFFVRRDKYLNENGGTWKSDHLLPTYYVYIEIRIRF